MPRMATPITPADRAFLLHLQTLALRYFLDNQMAEGLVLDRQANSGPNRAHGWRSTAASGMGFIALALASAEPFRLIARKEAIERVQRGLTTAIERLPHVQGIMPHFTDGAGQTHGVDACSTIDSAWLLAGGLWAAAFLRDAHLERLAQHLYQRVDWQFWTVPDEAPHAGLIRHGRDRTGQFLPCAWDRLNGETILLYVLAAGGAANRAWPAKHWFALRPFFRTVAGREFISGDLGLFVFQYGFDLLDIASWQEPGGLDLPWQANLAAQANYHYCRAAADRFETYEAYWGLSAGDGPATSGVLDTYRCYAPNEFIDGTAHLTATLASVAHQPALVLDQLHRANHDRLTPLGRYGFSNINLDRTWVSRDMVGIDAGGAVLALDNFLAEDRVRRVFHSLPCVAIGLERVGFVGRSTIERSKPVQTSLGLAS